MESKVHLYQLDFTPDASKSERKEMCNLLAATGASVERAYSTQRSGVLGLEYSYNFAFAKIITMNDSEDVSVHKSIKNNPVFSKSTLTQIL